MTMQEVLNEAIARGVYLYIRSGRLAYRAPQGAVSPELERQLRTFKDEIAEYLGRVAPLTDSLGANIPPLVRRDAATTLPLSYAQQRLWFIEQLGEGSAQYNIVMPFRLKGALNLEAFDQALHA